MAKIVKNRSFSHFFRTKLEMFGKYVCQIMLTHVVSTNKANKYDKTW